MSWLSLNISSFTNNNSRPITPPSIANPHRSERSGALDCLIATASFVQLNFGKHMPRRSPIIAFSKVVVIGIRNTITLSTGFKSIANWMIVPLITMNGKLNKRCGISFANIISFSFIGSDYKIQRVFASSEKLGLEIVTIPVLKPRPMQMNNPTTSMPSIPT